MKREFIPSVNFHLWEPCNMRCNFCFATFQDVKQSILPSGHLPKEKAIRIVRELASFGFEKITFAGGEPTLCPWLPELIQTAKQSGMTTMIVTNGSKLTDAFLQNNKNSLDWVAISIDSLNPDTNLAIGRAISGKTPLSVEYYKSLVEKVKQYGYGLKINTVINRRNYAEDMNDFIRSAAPKRWKILQALPISGQNDNRIDDFAIPETDFYHFVNTHNGLESNTKMVPETNTQIKGSYAMVDPAGRFFDNASGSHNYSKPILEIGISKALKSVNYNIEKFNTRGGRYNWKLNKTQFPLRITLSGEVASGKSTIGKLLAKELNYSFVSIGNKTREFAANKGMDIVEFQRECLLNPQLDIQIDQQFSADCNASNNSIIDYRLGFKFVKNAFHIYFKISEEAATERLKKANRINETHHTVRERNNSFKTQFQNTYSIDYTDEKNYNLVISIDGHETPVSIVKSIIQNLQNNQIINQR